MVMRKVMLLVCVLMALLVASPVMAQTTLNGAGATFPNPMYSKWFSEYHKVHSDVQINYQPIGSGGGIRQVTAGTVDFGASTIPLSAAELQSKGLIQIPFVLGGVVPVVNLPGF